MDPVLLPKKPLACYFLSFLFHNSFLFFQQLACQVVFKLIELIFFMTERFFNWQYIYKFE